MFAIYSPSFEIRGQSHKKEQKTESCAFLWLCPQIRVLLKYGREEQRVASGTLISGATVITMDEKLGDLAGVDLLVEDDRVAAIEPTGRLGRQGVEVVDAKNCIVIPGLVNTHMHTWQTALRRDRKSVV